MHSRIAWSLGSRKIACSTPCFPSVRPPPTLWPPRRHIYSVRKAERRRHWRLIFFICTEHFLQLFWTNSKHLNLFFRIWLMLENIVSRWKYGQTWLIWTCLQTPLENTLRLPPPCALCTHTCACTYVRSVLRLTARCDLFWARDLYTFPVRACKGHKDRRWLLWL